MIFCYCRGGDKKAQLVWAQGWARGLRSDYKAYFDGDIYLLDYPFHKARAWVAHEQAAKSLRPTITAVKDYEQREQLETLLLMDALLCGRKMWIPKFAGAVADIPQAALVGVSVPTRYSGFLPAPEELAGREIHLLGGDPRDWLRIMRIYERSTVVSVDGNIMGYKAMLGQSFENGRWVDYRKAGRSTEALLVESAINIKEWVETYTA